MHVDQDQIAGLARAQVVQVEHAGRGEQRRADRLHVLGVGRAVHQIVQRVPAERRAHFHDHPADDQRGDRIEQRIAEQVAHDPASDHQRRRGVRPRMPRVGHQHARLHARRDREHVAKQALLRDQRDERHPQCRDVDALDRLRMLELLHRRPQHPAADHQQDRGKRERRAGFEALMAVRMLFVDRLAAVMTGQQHDEIRDQIGQRMNAVRDEALRARQDADHHLADAQREVHRDAHPGASGSRGGHGGRRFGDSFGYGVGVVLDHDSVHVTGLANSNVAGSTRQRRSSGQLVVSDQRMGRVHHRRAAAHVHGDAGHLLDFLARRLQLDQRLHVEADAVVAER